MKNKHKNQKIKGDIMLTNKNNYLTDELSNGRKIKIMLMSHNSYWYYLLKLDREYEDCFVEVSADSTIFLKNRRYNILNDCDLILFFSSKEYSSYEFETMKKIAQRISEEKERRVTIGYSYILPIEQRKNSREIKISSYKNDTESEEIINNICITDPEILAGITLEKHDDFEKTQIFKKNKK